MLFYSLCISFLSWVKRVIPSWNCLIFSWGDLLSESTENTSLKSLLADLRRDLCCSFGISSLSMSSLYSRIACVNCFLFSSTNNFSTIISGTWGVIVGVTSFSAGLIVGVMILIKFYGLRSRLTTFLIYWGGTLSLYSFSLLFSISFSQIRSMTLFSSGVMSNSFLSNSKITTVSEFLCV